MRSWKRNEVVYDVFTLFNELDLLEIRLNLLEPFVDRFVIVEATETFSGKPKPLYFQEHRERFRRFSNKIVHYVVDDTPKDERDARQRIAHPGTSNLDRQILTQALSSDNVTKGVLHWFKEFYQKECIRKALVGLHDRDICYISDVDEIWNPAAVFEPSDDDIYKLRQHVYAYYLNNRSSEPWAGTLVTRYRNVKNACLNHLRTASKTHYTYIENGGWHFTNQGGIGSIWAKIEASYGSEDLNRPGIKSKVAQRMARNQDYIGREFIFSLDETGLPEFLLQNRERYRSMFLPADPRSSNPQRDTIVIRMQGGLGNQLFQYALGRALELAHHRTVRYDLSWFGNQQLRRYELDRFRTLVPFATAEQIERARRRPFWARALDAVRARIPTTYRTGFDPAVLRTNAPAYLDGYWQSERYFADISDQLRTELTVANAPEGRNAEELHRILQEPTVSLHVRRGDYVADRRANAFHGTASLDYYRRALDQIRSIQPDARLLVFSDDIPWVRTNVQTDFPTTYVDWNGPEQAYEDLRLMAACRHHIIANSSFSWWGAWLDPSPQKLVLAPERWYSDPAVRTVDHIPISWVTVPS
jgi:hypothetical protein